MNRHLWKLSLPALCWALMAPAVLAEPQSEAATAATASAVARGRKVKGDISAVNAGIGLTGGGVTGEVTLSVDFDDSGTSTRAARSDHTHGSVGENTAVGAFALQINAGGGNTAVGQQSLQKNDNGSNNTALGNEALRENTAGIFNTAAGAHALKDNIMGTFNTATGGDALTSNTSGNSNTANGFSALSTNTTGGANTASGFNALVNNTIGVRNTASGFNALADNTTGDLNTAVGNQALQNNSTGTSNIALGSAAGFNVTAGSDNIDIGSPGVFGDSKTIRIGAVQNKTFIDGIRGTTTSLSDAVPVVIDSAGQLGTVSSSERFKNEIKPMGQASEAILRLKPVAFHYKSDNRGTPQFGLIAEDVARVNPDLVVRDDNGEIYTVRYDAVNAMLLNEFLKEHRTVQELKSMVAKQKAAIAQQQQDFKAIAAQQQKEIKALSASLKEQALQIEKVSVQLKTNSPRQAPQVVFND